MRIYFISFLTIVALISVDIISHITASIKPILTTKWDGALKQEPNGDIIKLGRRSDGVIVWTNVISQ